MKQRRVGIFFLGREEIEVYARDGSGGEFYFSPEKGRLPRMKIGMDYENWPDVVDICLHEAMEFCLDNMRKRYECSYDITQDHEGYKFMFCHADLSEACARTGRFMANVLPELAMVYRKW